MDSMMQPAVDDVVDVHQQQQHQQQMDPAGFRQVVEQYVALCDRERNLKATLKETRSEMSELSERIIARMNHMSVDSCRLPGGSGRVVLKTTAREPTLTAKELNDIIAQNAPDLQRLTMQKRMSKDTKVVTKLTHRK